MFKGFDHTSMSASPSLSDSEMSAAYENNQEDVDSNLPEIPRLKIEDDDVMEYSRKPSLGGLMATDDDDEGFKTPTSLESKIPVPTECPPAPRRRSNVLTVSPKIRKRKTYRICTIARVLGGDLITLLTHSSGAVFPESSREDGSPEKTKKPPKDGDHEFGKTS